MTSAESVPTRLAGAGRRLAARLVTIAVGATAVVGILVVLDLLFLPEDKGSPREH